MALTNMRFKDQNWSPLRRDQKRGEEGEKRKREKKRRRGRGNQAKRYGTMTFSMELILVWIIWNLYGILEKFMSSKPRVC